MNEKEFFSGFVEEDFGDFSQKIIVNGNETENECHSERNSSYNFHLQN